MIKNLLNIRILAFFLLVCCSIDVFAQQYPVRINTLISPPYSARLSDYAESASDRLQVIINPLDLTLESYKVKIKLIIESLDGRIRIETDPGYIPPPLYLYGGTTEIITGYDLAEHFNLSHLVFLKGLTKNEYLVRKRLPENFYKIGFVLIDYNRSTLGGRANEIPVSNYGYSQAGIFLNDPPILNSPIRNSKLRLTDPQHIVLQWTPRHKGSPNSAFSAEYVIRLYEVWNENFSPSAIVQTQLPIYETVTSGNRFVYGPEEPMLIPGKKYVWTIQARDSEGRDMFRNDGMSEAYMFTWGEACKIPEITYSVAVNGPAIELKWNSTTGHTDYEIQYKPAGGATWYEENSLINNVRLSKLNYSTSYETRIKANCGTYSSEFCAPLAIKTSEAPVISFACGSAGMLPQLKSTSPLLALPPGAIFYAGGFECHVVESHAENGTFSGTCYVVVPYYGFAKVLHTFRNIRINTDLQMSSGKLVSVTDTVKGSALATKIDRLGQPAGTGFSNEQLEEILEADKIITVKGRIETITVIDGGQILITMQNGDEEIIEYEESEKLIISDKSGEQYIVQDNSVVSAREDLAAKASENTNIQKVENVNKAREHLPLVHFMPAPDMKYGFDSLQYPELRTQYVVNNIRDSEYVLPFKAVATGTTDLLNATMPSGEFEMDGLSFRINQVPAIARPSGQGNTRSVQVASLLKGDEQVLEAVYTLKDDSGNVTEDLLGQVNLVAYDKQILKLNIVPVGASNSYNKSEISRLINDIYRQSVVEWDINWSDPFESNSWDINGDQIFDDIDKDNRMDYTTPMKALIRAYCNDRGSEKQAVYVFLFDGAHATASLEGFMPLSKQFGFVFTQSMSDPSSLAHNIAHEIAHGTFNLRHTFSDENPFYQSKGSTSNLMDYSSANATLLNKYQWDLIHDPAKVWFGWMEEEGEGELVNIMSLLENIRNANKKEIQKIEILQDQCPSLCYKNLKLSSSKIDYLQVNCTKDFENSEMNEERITSWQKWKTQFGSKILVTPKEKSIVYSQTVKGEAISYQFHEIKQTNSIPLSFETTDNLLFEFMILKKDKERFEEYLYPNKKPIKGDPLMNMSIVHTNTAPISGGMFGCSRVGSGCDKSTIPSLPKYGDNKKVHDGIDLYAIPNTPVYTMFDGTVYLSKDDVAPNQSDGDNFLGNYLYIKSNSNEHKISSVTIIICYAHLNKVSVKNGQQVKQGMVIGETGMTGNAADIPVNRSHLHLTIYENDTQKSSKINPRKYVTTKFDDNGNKVE